MPKALITGITGQDGSYLAELLLAKGYDVIGMVRRTSTETFDRISHIQDRITLASGDLLDQVSLTQLLDEHRPSEVYNLAAQSYVPASWHQPVFTGEATALGVTRMLDAIRTVDRSIRFYQASSSEMFGKVQEVPQSERTPFYPRSPYGVAKVYGHWITVNYRESYDLFAVSGILFNHECISANNPLIVRQGTVVDVVTPDELVPLVYRGRSAQTFELEGHEIWDGAQWTALRAITATRLRTTDPDHQLLAVHARGGHSQVTAHHHMLDGNFEGLEAAALEAGGHVAMAQSFPCSPNWSITTVEMAEFIGLMVAEGHVTPDGNLRFTNNDEALRDHVEALWSRLSLGSGVTTFSASGWNPDRQVGHLNLHGDRQFGRWLREQIYHRNGQKRIPKLILNGTPETHDAFIRGYYAGDGLKAGNGQGIKTNSAVLAQGLCWLYAQRGQEASVYAEYRDEYVYYQLNLSSADPRGQKGQHLRKPASEVRSVKPIPSQHDWVFDLETESGIFCAGVGRIVMHNSPRRGREFVTRKITYGVAKIKLGLASELVLGNLEAQRDWGYAPDYVRAMWMMLQQTEPDDFVIATGETHSVAEFCELAFGHAGLDWRKFVRQDERFMRPAEVDLLIGDPSKARTQLGWQPEISFPELVATMVDSDIQLLKDGRTK